MSSFMIKIKFVQSAFNTHRCHNIICTFAFCKERQKTKRLTSNNIDISIIIIIIIILMPNTETKVIQALMRTF